MITKLKKLLYIESYTLNTYLEDVIIDDINSISKIITDLKDFTELISICLNRLEGHNDKHNNETISDIKSFIENIIFEEFNSGSDVLVSDIIDNSGIRISPHMEQEYHVVCSIINTNIQMYMKRYLNTNDYIRMPLYWVEIDNKIMLKIVYVYVE